MAAPTLAPNQMETPYKPYKCKDYPQKANGRSFFAFLFSIFIYVSVVYTLKLSPSSLINNTKFWFIISNTLVFIIAADYGVFSSSKEKNDFYEEYAIRHSMQARNNASSFVSQYPEIVRRSLPEREVIKECVEEEKKEVINPESEPSEKTLEIDVYSKPESVSEVVPVRKTIEEMKVGRSKSERFSLVAIDEGKSSLRRSETENYKAKEEEDEFSSMSNEELNRRVEEFIERFNRQMRLQRAANLGQI